MKKYLTLFLTAMVCAALAVTATASDLAASHGKHTTADGWVALSAEVLNEGYIVTRDDGGDTYDDWVLPTGKYYLTEDIDLSGGIAGSSSKTTYEGFRILADNTVTLCLNGYDVKYGNVVTKHSGRPFVNYGTLTLCDCCQNPNTTEGFIDVSTGLWTPKGAATPASDDITYNFTSGGTIYGGNANGGGGVYGQNTLVLENINVAGNISTGSGGGIFLGTAGSLTVNNVKVVGNKSTGAAKNGGGVYAAQSRPVTMADCVVEYNSLPTDSDTEGGGVFARQTPKLTNCVISNNTACIGGGIAVYGTTVLTDCTISNNTAKKYGGGIYSVYKCTLSSTDVLNNTVTTYDGGGIYMNPSSTRDLILQTNTKIQGNTAKRYGGGVYAGGGSNVKIYTCEISGNDANYGGGLCLRKGDATLTNGSIKGNTATTSGSALYICDDGVVRTGTVVEGTVATVSYTSDSVTYSGKYTDNGTVLFGVNSGLFQSSTAEYKLNQNHDIVALEGGTKLTGTHTVADGKELLILGTVDGGTFVTQGTGKILLREEYEIDGQTKISAGASANVASANRYHSVAYDSANSIWSVSVPNEAKVGSTEYKWLKQAIAAAQGTDATITILRNIDAYDTSFIGSVQTYYVTTAGHIVMDLAGHAITFTEGGLNIKDATGVTKIYSSTGRGTLDAQYFTIYSTTGGLRLEDLDILSHNTQAVSYMDNTGTFAADNLIKDCVIYNNKWVTFAFNRSSDMSNELMTFENTDLISGSTSATVGGQTKAVAPVAKFGQGMRFFSKGNSYLSSPAKMDASSKTPIKSGEKQTVSVGNLTLTDLNMWYIPNEISTGAELKELLEGSRAGEILLTANVTADITADLGTATLDLNGKTLTVNALIADEAEVKDSTNSTGKVVVGTTGGNANLLLNPANKQMAIGDASGFWFTDVAGQMKFEAPTKDTASYAFNFYLRNPNAKTYAINNPGTVKLGITATYGDEHLDFEAATSMEGVGALVKYLQQNPNAGLKLNVKGLKDLVNVKLNAWVRSNGTELMLDTKAVNPSTVDSVLFIGNSYTHTNSLNTIFKNIAAAAGYTVDAPRITHDSYYLRRFLDEEEYLTQITDALEDPGYDVVVLQETSWGPITEYTRFYEAVEDFLPILEQYGAQPMLYNTWGRRSDHSTLADRGETNESMTWKVAKGYKTVGETFGIPVAYAGLAFYDIYTGDSGIDLYYSETDGSHPSYAGSYLAAMTIFAKMYNEDPTAIAYDGKLSSTDAAILREAARKAVFETPEIPEQYQ